MKRFFTFLMAVWALLSISQTVKAVNYYITGYFVGESKWTTLGDKMERESVESNKYSQTYHCEKSGEYHFRFAGEGWDAQMCPEKNSFDLANKSAKVFYTDQEERSNNYFYVNMESGKTYTFTFDDSDQYNRTVACTVSGSSTTPTENYATFYLIGTMNSWKEGNTDYPFTTTDGKNYTCTFSGLSGDLYFKPKGFSADGIAFGKMLGPNTDTPITTDFQTVTYGGGAWTLKASSDKTYTITLQYNGTTSNPQIKYTEGGSGTVTPPTPPTSENPIANRKYSEGYYLVGNFFNFDGDCFHGSRDLSIANAMYCAGMSLWGGSICQICKQM